MSFEARGILSPLRLPISPSRRCLFDSPYILARHYFFFYVFFIVFATKNGKVKQGYRIGIKTMLAR